MTTLHRSARLLVLVGSFAAITVWLLGSAPHTEEITAQSAGFGVRFIGSLRLGGAFAPAGTRITVYQGQAIQDVTECGTTTVREDGQYQVDVPVMQGCGVTPTFRCCRFTFVAHEIPGQRGVRENVGSCDCGAFDLARPATQGRTVPQHLSGAKLPGEPDNGPNPILPAHWFYGVLTLAGRPAPAGVEIRVIQTRPAGSTTECGKGVVLAEGGAYALAIDAKPGCAEANNTPCCQFVFYVSGENVGGCACGIGDLNQLPSMGRQSPRNLAGSFPFCASGRLEGRVCVEVTAQPTPSATPLSASATAVPTIPPIVGNVTIITILFTLLAQLDPVLGVPLIPLLAPVLQPGQPPPPPTAIIRTPAPTPTPTILDCSMIGPVVAWTPDFPEHMWRHTIVESRPRSNNPNQEDSVFLPGEVDTIIGLPSDDSARGLVGLFHVYQLISEAVISGAGRWRHSGYGCVFDYPAGRPIGFDRRILAPGDRFPDPAGAPPGTYLTWIRLYAVPIQGAYYLRTAYPIRTQP